LRNYDFVRVTNNAPTLFASIPAFLYLNATWAKYLLDSSLQFQSSTAYGNSFAAPDLGSYPSVKGNTNGGEVTIEGQAILDRYSDCGLNKRHPNRHRIYAYSDFGICKINRGPGIS
jgi:hypothetical protein